MRALGLLLLLMVGAFPAMGQSRTYVGTPTTWYVNNSAGSDANPCTQILPCASIQRGVDNIASSFDLAAESVLQIVTTNINYGAVYLPSIVGNASLRIRGDTTNSGAVNVYGASDNAITCVNCHGIILDSFRVQSAQYGIVSDAQGHLLVRNMNFGPAGAAHMFVEHKGFLETLAGPYTVSGGAQVHIASAALGEFVSQGNVINFQNNPGFNVFVATSVLGFIHAAGFQGYTGPRYVAKCCDDGGGSGFAAVGPAGGVGWP